MTSLEISLSKEIISDHFGPIVEKVCTSLISKGRLLISQLINITKLTRRQIEEALFILIQQNIVKYAEKPRTQLNYYSVDINEVLMRIHFPIFINTIKEIFGKDGEEIAKLLLLHGRLSLTSLLTYVEDIDSIKNTFCSMVAAGFIIAVRPEDSISMIDKLLAEEDIEVSKLGASLKANDVGRIRVSLAVRAENEYDNNVATGMKRKAISNYDDYPSKSVYNSINDIDENIISRLNYNKLLVHCRNKCVINLVKERLTPSAAELMKEILKIYTEEFNDCKRNSVAGPFSAAQLSYKIHDIKLKIDYSKGGGNKNPIVDYLETYRLDSVKFLTKDVERGNGDYYLNFKQINNHMKVDLIGNTIKEKYGSNSMRLWKILLDKGKFDEKQIAKVALVSHVEARKCLFELLNAGYTYLQEIPKTVDRNTMRSTFLWYTDMNKAEEQIISECYKVLINLKKRRKLETEKLSKLIEKSERDDVKKDKSLLNEAEIYALEELKKILNRIDISEVGIGKMLLILKEF
ncbi:RNA polymerase III subunit RPC82 helix-turn-helix domain-containing protein [Neocallimastix lanati (nom. inval.)]|jgi:transcription initiation factor IIE alpha subunit|nr:RNA polymerase III subunit RPC82 helix-turn-helix domain-containing protein [Neocallimastix sp. JGI-2020a]